MQKQSLSPVEMMQKSAEQAEATLKLLANANRLLILCQLVHGEKAVSELAKSVGLSHSALSQHLARMRNLGIVTTVRKGQWVYYSLSNPEVEAILATLYSLYCKE